MSGANERGVNVHETGLFPLSRAHPARVLLHAHTFRRNKSHVKIHSAVVTARIDF